MTIILLEKNNRTMNKQTGKVVLKFGNLDFFYAFLHILLEISKMYSNNQFTTNNLPCQA